MALLPLTRRLAHPQDGTNAALPAEPDIHLAESAVARSRMRSDRRLVLIRNRQFLERPVAQMALVDQRMRVTPRLVAS